MKEKFNIDKWKIQASILVLCIASRMLTSLHYVADPDSLRFALAATDFDVTKLQPHFPGYPVFCFLLQLFTLILGKFSLAFSLIGGLSTYVIIHYLIKLARWANWSLDPWLIAGAVFFNPMIWIMGNRYMPDLMGLALTVAGCALFIRARDDNKYALGMMLVAGLLAGTRLSYLPVLVLPVIWTLIKSKQRLMQLIAGTLGIAVWLVPMIIDTGWNELINVAGTHTHGHFNDWGGTIETEPSYYTRFIVFFQSIIADGLGGYWSGRNVITIAASILILTGIVAAVINSKRTAFADAKSKILLLSVFVYAIWVFLFQNIIYNPRHIMPLVPVILLAAAAGYTFIAQKKRILLITGIAFICVSLIITLALVRQHMKPTAIAQAAEALRNDCNDRTLIISTELINYYMSGAGVKCDKLNVVTGMEDISEVVNKYDRIITIGNFDPLHDLGEPQKVNAYYHNPYVNRIWAEISVKEYITRE